MSYWENEAELLEYYAPLSFEEALALHIMEIPIFWGGDSGDGGYELIQVWWGLELIQKDLESGNRSMYYISREKVE